MVAVFPPTPVFPDAIDNDRTLFLVFNTTETKLSADNAAWAEEIAIVPVESDKEEIWSKDGGFANLEGELVYYDSVEFDIFDKINKLKRVARNLGGKKSKYNKKCSWIRSYVVAEHHNQLVTAVLKTQDFIGFNFDPRFETLDWRIRNLQALEPIFDDFDCPDVNFTFNIIETDNEAGILTEFLIELDGPVNNFRLDFGDGSFTTTELQGQHRYALNATIDPTITVINDKCQLSQTPVNRINPQEPPIFAETPFDIAIPEFEPVPDFDVVPCVIPENDVSPPLVLPCVSIAGTDINISTLANIPSFIDSDLPSRIEIIGCNIPSFIEVIAPDISVIDDIPETIVVEGIPSSIVVDGMPSSLAVDFGMALENMPKLEINWGNMPELEVKLAMSKDVKITRSTSLDPGLVSEFGEEFADLFDDKIKVEYETAGIPTEIKIIPPKMNDLKIDTSELDKVKIQFEKPNIPSDIKIHGPETPIPTIIQLLGPNDPLPKVIRLINEDVPTKIEAINVGIPTSIDVHSDIPDRIVLELGDKIPQMIEDLSNALVLKGVPEFIPIKMPDELINGLKLIPPDEEEMPKMQLVYSGAPIEMKINLFNNLPQPETDENAPCFMLVPCR